MSQLFLNLESVYFLGVDLQSTKRGIRYFTMTTSTLNTIMNGYRDIYIKDNATGHVMFMDLLSFLEYTQALTRKEMPKYYNETEGVFSFYHVVFKAMSEIELRNLENNYVNISPMQKVLMTRFHHTWYNFLYEYLTSEKFREMVVKIADERKIYDVFPEISLQFRAFKETPLNKVKVIFVGYDPYPAKYANGLAFACDSDNYTPKSLAKIEDAFKESIFKDSDMYGVDNSEINNIANWKIRNNLLHLCSQGVMLLNSSLTIIKSSEPTVAHKHWMQWSPFTRFIMKKLNNRHEPIIFVFFGSKAEEYKKHISASQHYVFVVDHPASSAYSGEDWYYKDVFNQLNEVLITNKQKPILWI